MQSTTIPTALLDSRAPQQNLSLVRGATSPPLHELTLGRLVDQQAERYGSKEALLVGWTKARLTFQELSWRTKELAKSLLAMGVGKGDRVAIFSGDDERFVELFFAAGRLGACLVILNKTYTLPECIRAIKHAEPCVLFIADEVNRKSTTPLLEHLRVQRHGIRHVALLRWDQMPHRFEPTWDDVLDAGRSVLSSELARVEQSVDMHSTVNLQFTSGTTGAPKAAMLSHYNIINNGFTIGEYLGLVPDDVLCCGPPLFHCFGLVAGFMAAFTHGSTIGFAGRDFDAEQVVDMLVREECTALHGVPTMFTAVLHQLNKAGIEIKTVRKGIAAGTKVPPALLSELHRRLGYEHIAITYGMTETSPASFMTEISDTMERKLETVGRVLPHVAAKVIDAENRILPLGVPGEICVSGYLLQQGYFKAPEKTAEVMIRDENGVLWMHTGDEATIDEHGYVRITGRIKDIIIRGGENIYPLEIEERLLHHPDLCHVSVVGVKDERYGEAVTACLEVRPGHTKPSHHEIRVWVQQELGRHKAPQHVIWVGKGEPIEEYPVTGSGKIQKNVLSKLANAVVEAGEGALVAKL